MSQTLLELDTQADLHQSIVSAIASEGYAIIQQALPDVLLQGLYARARADEDRGFKPAGIGREGGQHRDSAVRGDHICWLSAGEDAFVDRYLGWMERLRQSLNRQLFLGLFDFEAHFAQYPTGTVYQRHLDAFRGRSNRLLSTLLYLNPDWQTDDGGELLIYATRQDKQELRRVVPEWGTLVVFLSEQFPHEVLAARRPRLSIAGWFRENPSSGRRIDPAR